jgi:hypothetical protein
MSKNLQHSKVRAKTFNLSKSKNLQPSKEKTKPSTSLRVRTKTQPPRAKTKAFNLSKSKNKYL